MIYLKAISLVVIGIITQFIMIDDYLRKVKNTKLLFLDAWLLPSMLWVLISIALYFVYIGEL